jgi:hypothetical protein
MSGRRFGIGNRKKEKNKALPFLVSLGRNSLCAGLQIRVFCAGRPKYSYYFLFSTPRFGMLRLPR